MTRRCVRGGRCAAHERDPDTGARLGAPTEAQGVLCPVCVRRLEQALAELPGQYVQLWVILGQHQRAREKVSGSPELPVPVRLDVMDLQRRIDAELSRWAPHVAALVGVDWDAATMAAARPGYRVDRAAWLLSATMPALLKVEPVDVVGWIGGPVVLRRDGIDAATELLHLHTLARFLVTGGTGDVRLPVPCPFCEGVLIRRNGADHVDCQGCVRSWPEQEYRHLCLVLAQDYRR